MKKGIMHIAGLFLACGLLVSATGCGEKETVMTTININKDGSIGHTIMEPFETGTDGSVEELTNMIRKEIAELPGEGITVEDAVLTEDGKVKVNMSFPDMKAFHDYNNIETTEDSVFFYGTVEECAAAGFDLNSITVYENGHPSGKSLTGESIREHGSWHILIYDNAMNNYEPVEIRMYEKIHYATAGVNTDGKNAFVSSDIATWICLLGQ